MTKATTIQRIDYAAIVAAVDELRKAEVRWEEAGAEKVTVLAAHDAAAEHVVACRDRVRALVPMTPATLIDQVQGTTELRYACALAEAYSNGMAASTMPPEVSS